MSKPETTSRIPGHPPAPPGEPRLEHVAEPCACYPGEEVTLYTRLHLPEKAPARSAVGKGAPAHTLRISIPNGVEILAYRQLQGAKIDTARLEVLPNAAAAPTLVWVVEQAGLCEYATTLKILPTLKDLALQSRAELFSAEGESLAQEEVCVLVRSQGRYLRLLPELYAEDDLMARFLMLFESFWAPIDRQVNGIDNYFDPGLAPEAFLLWLASWLGMEWGENTPASPLLTAKRQRQLIRSAVWLHRSRGTRLSLQRYLEIFTGGKVEILEHRANDFRIGKSAMLGPNIAFGKGNYPHTFTVTLRLPQPHASDPHALRRAAEDIINEQKPAHTRYTLHIESAALPEPAASRSPER